MNPLTLFAIFFALTMALILSNMIWEWVKDGTTRSKVVFLIWTPAFIYVILRMLGVV